MKIIKVGVNDPNWTRQVTCGATKGRQSQGCGAVLEVGFDDLYVKGTHDIGGARTSAFCRCPSCGHRVEICDVSFFITDLPHMDDWEAAHPEIVAAAEAADERTCAARATVVTKHYDDRY